jgi:hypothetical protein
MALISCRECGNPVSNSAPTCPKCGAPVKKKTSFLVKLLILILLFPLVVSVLAGILSSALARRAAARGDHPATVHDQVRAQLGIAEWKFYRKVGGSVMEATFVITNSSPCDVKDLQIECVHSAPSGTQIDSSTHTIYEVIKAGETRTLTNVNMGFIHSQTASSSARIQSFTVIQ